MPLLSKFEISGAVCAVWRVEESLDEIMSVLDDPQSVEEAMSYGSDKRRMEYLVSRMLLKHILESRYEHVQYEGSGKPLLPVCGKHLSISHSGDYVAVALSDCNEVGVDIEKSGDKVMRVIHKFLSEEEISSLSSFDTLHDVLIRWSAKESVYKIVGQEAYNYREVLSTGMFDSTRDGSLVVRFRKPDETYECFDVAYRTGEDFVFTVAVRI